LTILCVIPGPAHVYATEPDDKPTRWCFTCRKHGPHFWEYIGDPPDVESYYDPQWVIRCLGCGGSDIHFPGCEPL
jgi:hypothetical protein